MDNEVYMSLFNKKEKKKQLHEIIYTQYLEARDGPNSCYSKANNIEDYISTRAENLKTKTDVDDNFYIDLLFMAIENINAFLSDQPIDALISHKKPGTELDAKIYQLVVNHIFEQSKIKIKRSQMQKYKIFFGMSGFNIDFIDDKKDELFVNAYDPRNLVADPMATNMDDLQYIICPIRYTRGEWKQKYPEKKTEIDMAEGFVRDLGGKTDIAFTGRYEEEDKDLEFIWGLERFFKVQVSEEYPYGWRYTVVLDNTVLCDEPSGWCCGHPYTIGPCFSIPDRLSGRDYVSILKPISDKITSMFKHVDNILSNLSNPPLLYRWNVLKKKGWKNQAGARIPVWTNGPISDVAKWLDPAPIAPGFFSFASKLEDFFITISGIYDILQGRGRVTASMPSGVSIDKMSENAQAKFREIIRNIKEYDYIPTIKKLIHLIHVHYTEDKVIRITGASAKEIKSIMYRQELEIAKKAAAAGADTTEKIQTAIDVYMEEERGFKIIDKDENDVYMRFNGSSLADPTDFDIRVNAGTDIPKGKLDNAKVIWELFKAKQIDLESLLEGIDFPDKERVLSRNADMKLLNIVKIAVSKNPQILQLIQQVIQGNKQQGQQGQGRVSGKPPANPDTGSMRPGKSLEGNQEIV